MHVQQPFATASLTETCRGGEGPNLGRNGGLPEIYAGLQARLQCDCVQKVFRQSRRL